jgi:hypothetical protein
MKKQNLLLLVGAGAVYYFMWRKKQLTPSGVKGIEGIKKNNENKFDYMLLGRLADDCDYFLGNGKRYEGDLWGLNVNNHIKEMKKIYKKLPKKPEWLSYNDILNYENKMRNK